MSRTNPESRYIQKIHRQLDKFRTDSNELAVYHQKMNMMPMSSNGIPDIYYEGNNGQLFVEYKAIPSWENKRSVPMNMITPAQNIWLKRAVNNNRNCCVIFGDETGKSLILNSTRIFTELLFKDCVFSTPSEVAYFIKLIVTKKNEKTRRSYKN